MRGESTKTSAAGTFGVRKRQLAPSAVGLASSLALHALAAGALLAIRLPFPDAGLAPRPVSLGIVDRPLQPETPTALPPQPPAPPRTSRSTPVVRTASRAPVPAATVGSGTTSSDSPLPGTGQGGTGAPDGKDTAGSPDSPSGLSGGDRIASVAPLTAPASADAASQRQAYALELRKALVASRGRYPSLARRKGLEGRVTLRVRVDSTGSVTEVALQQPSEHPLLDQAALASARGLARLPPPPGGPIDVLVPVVFSLREM